MNRSIHRFFLLSILLIPVQLLFAADTPNNVNKVVQGILSHKPEDIVAVHDQVRGLSDEVKLALYDHESMQDSEHLPVVAASIMHQHKIRGGQAKKSSLAEKINEIASWARDAHLWTATVQDKEVVLRHQLSGEQLVVKADLLKSIPVLQNCVADFGDSVPLEVLLSQALPHALRNDSVDDVKRLIRMLQSVQEDDQQTLTEKVSALSDEQLNCFYKQANRLNIKDIQEASAKRMANELKGIEGLPNELEYEVKSFVDVDPLLDAIESRLTINLSSFLKRYEFIWSAVYNKAEKALLIRTDDRVLIYDVTKEVLTDTGFKCQAGEFIRSAVYNKAENVLLICTSRRVLIYDKGVLTDTGFKCQAGEFIRSGEFICSAVYNESEKALLISTTKRVLIYDKGVLKDIGLECQAREIIFSAVYNADNALLIRTNERVLIYGKGMLTNTGFRCQAGEDIRSAVYYNRAQDALLIRTTRRVLIYDEGVLKDIGLECQEGECVSSAVYNKAQDALLICTNQRVLICDVTKGVLTDIGVECQAGEFILSAVYNRAENALLIRTTRRVLICDKGVLKDLGVERQAGEFICSAVYNGPQDALLVCTNQRVLIYDVTKEVLKDIGLECQEGECVSSAVYNRPQDALLIRTTKRIVQLPLTDRLLPQLSLEQLKFLKQKALPAWQSNQPYIVTEEDEAMYVHLPNSLKRSPLFNNKD